MQRRRCVTIGRHRFIELAADVQLTGEVDLESDRLWFALHGDAEGGFGGGEIAAGVLDQADGVVNVAAVGIDRQRATDKPGRALVAMGLVGDDRQDVQGVEVIRIGADELFQQPLRVRPSAGLVVRDSLLKRHGSNNTGGSNGGITSRTTSRASFRFRSDRRRRRRWPPAGRRWGRG
jgi:hypothetical protein